MKENNNKGACWIGMHSYQIHKEVDLINTDNLTIGTVIISRCEYCGKIKSTKIKIVESRYS